MRKLINIFRSGKKSTASKSESEGSVSGKMEQNLSAEVEKVEESGELEQIEAIHKKDQKRFVRENCEAIAENDRQIQAAKKEYEKVTAYLSDIQKIDRIEREQRKELIGICKEIVRLTNERNKYKNRNLTITEQQVRRFEMYDEELVPEIRKMYGAEAYQKAIESDIENLQKEKKNIYKERREIVEKQNALKSMAKVLAALILSLFVLFIVVYYALKTDMTFPYLGTILLAAISATVLFVESNRNRRDIVLADRKLSKAVTLMNRVKIKYVNNVNVLDYNREKYGVKNAKDFEALWNEYCKLKEYERKFRENTEMLNYNNERMIEFLKQYEVLDCDVWISQAVAIIDDREMVEIRHGLNVRRQKLRERIEYNESVKSDLLQKIDEMIQRYPENQKAMLAIVREFSKETAAEI